MSRAKYKVMTMHDWLDLNSRALRLVTAVGRACKNDAILREMPTDVLVQGKQLSALFQRLTTTPDPTRARGEKRKNSE